MICVERTSEEDVAEDGGEGEQERDRVHATCAAEV
jgi:hypothetical protein